MATRKTNIAVEAYRKLMRQELRIEEAEAELTQAVADLTEDELATYVGMTNRMEESVALVREEAEERYWAPSTRRQAIVRAIASSGLDRKKEGSTR